MFSDWNFSPEVLSKSGAFDLLRCSLLKPQGVDITCWAGKGAMFDYAMAASNAQWLLGDSIPVNCAWKAHFVLEIAVTKKPQQLQIRTLRAPKNFDLPILAKKVRAQFLETLRTRISWENAERHAAAYLQQSPCVVPGFIQNTLAFELSGKDALVFLDGNTGNVSPRLRFISPLTSAPVAILSAKPLGTLDGVTGQPLHLPR